MMRWSPSVAQNPWRSSSSGGRLEIILVYFGFLLSLVLLLLVGHLVLKRQQGSRKVKGVASLTSR